MMPGRRLHQRLDHQRRDPRVMLGQQAIERGQRVLQQAICGHPGRQAIGVGHGGAQGFEQQRAEQLVEAGHAADADRPQRIAVIGLAQGHVTGLLRLRVRPLPPILKGHLQRDLHGRGPVVAEEDVPQARRGQIDQPLGQQDGRRVRRAEVRDVGHAVELRADGRVDPRMPMTVDVAPQAADRVEIAAAVDIEDVAAFAALQDQRLVLGHLREGVPDERAVPVAELVGRERVHSRVTSRFALARTSPPERSREPDR